MDSQRLHLRSTVILDQDLLDQLPPVSPEFELLATAEARIVANTIVVVGGTLRGYHLKLVAESITAADASAAIALGLVNRTAPNLLNGRAGHPLTVVAARLNGGGGTTRGQRGGKGRKGRDGVDMPEIPQPEPQPGDPDGPPIQVGRNGEQGGDGLRGGDGGPVTLVLMEPSTHTGHWFGAGGTPGEGGEGGVGEPVPVPGIDGEPGDPGNPGPRGDDKPATVSPVDVAGYRQGIAAALVLLDWARFRRQLAVEEFRRDNAAVALDELDAAVQLVAADERPSLADELPALVRDNRTVTGVARDQDLVPDIAHFAGAYQVAAARLRAAITDQGFLLFADPSARLHAIRAALDVLTGPGGELTVQTNDLADRSERALAAVIDLRARTISTLNRIDNLLAPDSGVSPVIILPGPPPVELDARTVAAGLADVLGAKDPGALPAPAAGTVLIPEPADGPPFRPELDPVTLLPANVELLVHRSVRDRRIIPSTEVSAIAQRAVGLAGIDRWADVATAAVDDDGIPVAVHLGHVAADLRAAQGDRPLLDLLVELAEITHVWRLARARIEQLLAGARTVAHQKLLASAARGAFFPLEPDAADLLPGLRCLLDALAWRAERADRAADILTFGHTRPPSAEIVRYPLHPEVLGDLSRLAPLIHAPDWERDLREATPGHFQPLEYDLVVGAVTGLDHTALYDDYLERGIALVGAGPPSVVREFRVADRPDVFTRFASGAGNLWFDVTLGDVAGELGTVPHRETRVVGIKITLDFEADAPVSSVTLLATHTGLSVQRDLDGTARRQQMLPAAVEVGLAVPTVDGTPAPRTLEGEVRVDESTKVDFAAYGRGAAAGWLIAKADNTVELDGLQTIRVEVFYEGIVEHGTVSLRSVASAPAASQVGSDLAIVVRLTAPAGPNGVLVFLSSSDPAVIKTPGAIVVPAGQVEARGLAAVVGPTGDLRPTISARTADGVTRQVRPIVPPPRRPLTAAVRLTASDIAGHVAAVAVLPGAPGQPGQPLATLSPLPAEPGDPPPPCLVHHRGADLGLVRQAKIGNGPRSLAVDPGRRRIYVANSGTGSINVSMLDAGTLNTLGEQVVGSIIDVEVDAAAGLVYASRFNPGEIIVLSADDLSIVARLTDPAGRLRRPHGIAVVPEPDGGATIYVARTARGIPDEESAVTQIRRDAAGTHTVVQSLRFDEVGTQPVDVAVDPVHALVFVACLGGGGVPPRLIVLEHPTLTELGRVRLLSTGRAVATRPGSGLAYVVGEAGLMIVDGASRTLASRVATGGFPIAVAVDPVTGTAYVGRRDDATLVRVDPPRSATPTFW